MKTQTIFGHHIYKYQTEMLKDLNALISIPSICTDAIEQKPFGQECADALDCILAIAKRLSLPTTNIGYYAGDAFYGEGSSYVDVLTHIDVVPAGDHWSTNPFSLIQKQGNLYGRGVADDKGAAIAALYGLKALKDAGITGKHCIRAVFGCGEEIGSNDLDIYYGKRKFPVMGFTPDCHYGICQSEKGILRLRFDALHPHHSIIKQFHAGTTVNSVPAKAYAVLHVTPSQYDALADSANSQSNVTLSGTPDSLILSASGTAAHGAEPELGVNAASALICLLTSVFQGNQLGSLFSFAGKQIKSEYDGSSLEIACSDFPSGPLTLNLGIINADEQNDSMTLDIRYPVTADKDSILSKIIEIAACYDIIVTEESHTLPLYSASDSKLVKTLSASYEAVMQSACSIYSTGGGTYARHSGNTAVAFGPVFENDPPTNAHGPNEFLSLESYMKHAEICLEAMYRLFTSIDE